MDKTASGAEGCRKETLRDTALFLSLVVIILVRSWPTFAYPGLYLEDSPYFFTFYYGGHRTFSEIFRMPGTDYMTLVNEAVAWLTEFMDVRIQPYFYTFFSLFIGVATCVLSLRIYRFRRVEFILLTPLALALVGIGRVSYYAVMVGSAWVMMILLFTLMLMKVSESKPWAVFHTLLMMLLCWAHPYSIIAVPLSVLIVVMNRDPKQALALVLVMLSALAYAVFATDKEVAHFPRLGDWNLLFSLLSRYYSALVHGVIFMGLVDEVPVILSLAVWIFLAALLIFLRDREVYRTSLLMLFIIFSALGIYYLSNRQVIFRMEDPGLLIRYMLISLYFWIFLLMYWSEKLWDRLNAGPLVRIVFSLCCLIWITGYNLEHRNHFIFQREDPRAVSIFTETVAYYETRIQAGEPEYVKIRLKPGRHMHAFIPEAVIGNVSKHSKNLGKEGKGRWDPKTGYLIVPP